jgi:CRISPR type II-A-associated protein Csn2
MLTLSRYGIEPNIEVTDASFFTLVIERKEFLLSLLSELRLQTDGRSGDFHLLLNDRELHFEKSVSAVFDFTNIDFNSKTITNLLTKKFSEFLGLGEQTESISTLEGLIITLTEDFREHSGLNVEYDTVLNAVNLAKVCSLRIMDDKTSLLERLAEYVNLLCDLKPLKLLMLIFGKEFLSEKDIDSLYLHCYDRQVRLLIIEGVDTTKLMMNERRLIIDKDLCTIPLGYGEEWSENLHLTRA